MTLLAAITVWTVLCMRYDRSPSPLTRIHIGNAVLLGTALLV